MLILWIPFICRFELAGGDGEETIKKIELGWLFMSRTIDTAATTGRREEKKEKKRDLSRAFELVRTLHYPAITLVRNVVRSIRIKELSCRMTFGLSNPADTGMLTGFLCLVSAVLTRSPAVSIRLYPVFWEPIFRYRASGLVSITVGRIIIPIVVFVCSRPVRAEIVRCIHYR